MFDIFGEFNTYEEINQAAQGLKAEQDIKNLRILAEENGIEKEIANLYISGQLDELTDCETAAIGKLDVEAAELKPKEIMEDWLNYIKGCVEKDEKMAMAVRKKGKSLKGCIAELLVWSFKNSDTVDRDILKAANVNSTCRLGIPGMGTAKQLIKKYYLRKQAKR